MGDSVNKKTIRFDSFIALLEAPSTVHTRGSQVLDAGLEAAGPVHRSHDRPARIVTQLLIAFAE